MKRVVLAVVVAFASLVACAQGHLIPDDVSAADGGTTETGGTTDTGTGCTTFCNAVCTDLKTDGQNCGTRWGRRASKEAVSAQADKTARAGRFAR
jgi:hypothetical protein